MPILLCYVCIFRKKNGPPSTHKLLESVPNYWDFTVEFLLTSHFQHFYYINCWFCQFYLGVVDREWALCMHHQISLPLTIWVIDNLCTAGLAACCLLKKSRDQFFPRQHRVTRGAHHRGTSMLCLWGCGSRGCISLVLLTVFFVFLCQSDLVWLGVCITVDWNHNLTTDHLQTARKTTFKNI